jgi:hypothetical protein
MDWTGNRRSMPGQNFHARDGHGPKENQAIPNQEERHPSQPATRDPQPTPRPATVRTRRGHALHGLSCESVTRTGPGAGDDPPKLHTPCSARRSCLLEQATLAAPDPLKRQETRTGHLGPHPRDRLAGRHRTADPQDGPRAAGQEATVDAPRTTAWMAAHRRVCTWARQPATQIKPTEQS